MDLEIPCRDCIEKRAERNALVIVDSGCLSLDFLSLSLPILQCLEVLMISDKMSCDSTICNRSLFYLE